MTTMAGICIWCKHYQGRLPKDGRSDDKKLTSHACAAFPAGIPGEIFFGEVKHAEPYEGDNGIQFEQKEKK